MIVLKVGPPTKRSAVDSSAGGADEPGLHGEIDIISSSESDEGSDSGSKNTSKPKRRQKSKPVSKPTKLYGQEQGLTIVSFRERFISHLSHSKTLIDYLMQMWRQSDLVKMVRVGSVPEYSRLRPCCSSLLSLSITDDSYLTANLSTGPPERCPDFVYEYYETIAAFIRPSMRSAFLKHNNWLLGMPFEVLTLLNRYLDISQAIRTGRQSIDCYDYHGLNPTVPLLSLPHSGSQSKSRATAC